MKNTTTTLDEILGRNDYCRLTATLKERVEEIASRVRQKMVELDIDNDDAFWNGEIGVDTVTVRIVDKKSSVGTYSYLAIKREVDAEYDSTPIYSYFSLEDIDRDFYYSGDFNARVQGASNKEALAFLNVAKKFIQGLGEIEQEKVKAIENALENNKSFSPRHHG